MGKTSKANRKKAPVATPAATATAAIVDYGSFPKSTFSITANTFRNKRNDSKAKKLYLQGIQNGCGRCMSAYAYTVFYDGQSIAEEEYFQDNKHLHLALPLFLEGFIRGNLHPDPDDIFVYDGIYEAHEMSHDEDDYSRFGDWTPARPLCLYWKKHASKTGNDDQEDRSEVKQDCKAVKERRSNHCAMCKKEEDPETVTLRKCDGCHFYFYCSRKCQKKMWVEGQHAGVCRQLGILQKYHKPFAKKIWEDLVVRQMDPRDIPELQDLRRRLGLSRPLADYQDLLDDAKAGRLKSAELILPRQDGTVQIGSFPGQI